jgi:hypothetical protein
MQIIFEILPTTVRFAPVKKLILQMVVVLMHQYAPELTSSMERYGCYGGQR